MRLLLLDRIKLFDRLQQRVAGTAKERFSAGNSQSSEIGYDPHHAISPFTFV